MWDKNVGSINQNSAHERSLFTFVANLSLLRHVEIPYVVDQAELVRLASVHGPVRLSAFGIVRDAVAALEVLVVHAGVPHAHDGRVVQLRKICPGHEAALVDVTGEDGLNLIILHYKPCQPGRPPRKPPGIAHTCSRWSRTVGSARRQSDSRLCKSSSAWRRFHHRGGL